MEIRFAHLLDPEFLIPSKRWKFSAEFWLRLGDLKSSSAKMGANTYLEFLRFYREEFANDAGLKQLAGPSLLPWLAKVVTEEKIAESMPINGAKIDVAEYTPHWGSPGNAEVLAMDLERSGAFLTTLRSAPECWRSAQRPPVGVITSDCVHARSLREKLSSLDLLSLEIVRDNANILFPNLVFHQDAWDGISKFKIAKGQNERVMNQLVDHLAVLNDDVLDIWECNLDTNEREKILKASHGIRASMESTKTRGQPSKMAERYFRFESRSSPVKCEWHTKLDFRANRIHFKVEMRERRVYIGAITDHLST